jgi:hypothetical protein
MDPPGGATLSRKGHPAMRTHRRHVPDPKDPLWLAILEESARQDADADAGIDVDDPVLLELVEEAVAPYEAVLTPEALDEARYHATVALVTHPDLEQLLQHRRLHPVPESSGTRTKLTPAQLIEAARRRRGAS